MNARGLFAARWAVVCLGSLAVMACGTGITGCMAPPEEGEETRASEEAPQEEDVEEPLDLSVDTLDVVHGSLRIIATMTDGAADVSVLLGGDCDHREVGGGISTLSTLVWAFGEEDVADALKCGLVVRARAKDGDGFVSKVAPLDVAATTTSVDENSEAPEDAPSSDTPALQGAGAAEDGIHLVFAPLSASARLTTGDSVLDATRPEPSDDDPQADRVGEFTVPRIDFARSVLRNRALYVDGTPFVTSLSVGGVSLDGSTAAAAEVEADGEVEHGEEEVPAAPLTDDAIARE